MDEVILNAINKLLKTLQNVGFIKDTDITNLYVVSFVDKMYKNPYLYNKMSIEDKQFYNELVQCLADNSCLFNGEELPELAPKESTVSDAIITILEEFITTQQNEVNVPINGGTKKFTDFVFKPFEGLDDSVYTVGYDSDENTEVRINVTDLGIFWE